MATFSVYGMALVRPNPRSHLDEMPSHFSRRSFLQASATLVALPLVGGAACAQPDGGSQLIAYVGTFSSPLRDTLPTQVDLPPGNGR